MKVYVNAGFGEPLSPEDYAFLREHNVAGIRQDIPTGAPRDYIESLVENVTREGLEAIFVVGGWSQWANGEIRHEPAIVPRAIVMEEAQLVSQAALLAGVPYWLEPGNEPTITDGFAGNPGAYAVWARNIINAAREANPRTRLILSCGHNLDRATVDYARQACSRASCLLAMSAHRVLDDGELWMGIHPYRTTRRPADDIDGRTIETAIWELMMINPQLIVTEGGWHTAESRVRRSLPCLPARRVQWSDADVAEFAREEFEIWASAGAAAYTWFQLNDGPGDGYEDRYGIRYRSGEPKPVALVIKKWGESNGCCGRDP